MRYQYLAPMLLNEVQKQYRRAEQQSEIIETQQKQLEAQRSQIEAQRSQLQAQAREMVSLKLQLQQQNASLQERLSKLESLCGHAGENRMRGSADANHGHEWRITVGPDRSLAAGSASAGPNRGQCTRPIVVFRSFVCTGAPDESQFGLVGVLAKQWKSHNSLGR